MLAAFFIASFLVLLIHQFGKLIFITLFFRKGEAALRFNSGNIFFNYNYRKKRNSDQIIKLNLLTYLILIFKFRALDAEVIQKDYKLWKDFWLNLSAPLFTLFSFLIYYYFFIYGLTDSIFLLKNKGFETEFSAVFFLSSLIILTISIAPLPEHKYGSKTDGLKLLEIINFKRKGYSAYVFNQQLTSFLLQKNYKAAKEYFQIIKKFETKLTGQEINSLYLLLLRIAFESGNKAEALALCKEKEESFQKDSTFWGIYGFLLNEQNDSDIALQTLLKALGTDNKDNLILFNMAFYFFKLNKYDEALKYLDKILTDNSEMELALNLKAEILLKLKKYKNLTDITEHILKINNTNVDAMCKLGLAKIKTGKEKDGLEILNRALEIDNKSADIYKILGIYLFDKNNYEKSLEFFNKAYELNNSLDELNIYMDRVKKFIKTG